jgi:ribonuclease P protein component
VLAREHRIRKPGEFKDVIRGGRRAGGRSAVVYAAPAGGDCWKAGFVVSKAVGNSVVRHRVTRRLRAIAAREVPALEAPRRVVVRALLPAAACGYDELAAEVASALRRAAG